MQNMPLIFFFLLPFLLLLLPRDVCSALLNNRSSIDDVHLPSEIDIFDKQPSNNQQQSTIDQQQSIITFDNAEKTAALEPLVWNKQEDFDSFPSLTSMLLLDGTITQEQQQQQQQQLNNNSVNNITIAVRVVGGTVAKTNEVPWQAGLLKNGKVFCGGAVIRADAILTAAHCLTKGITVITGTSSISRSNSRRTVSRVIRAVAHGRYVGRRANVPNDLAILKISPPLQLGSGTTRVIDLPPPRGKETLPAGTLCKISGWGSTNGQISYASSQLRQAMVPLVSHAECSRVYSGAITSSMLCAGYKTGGVDTCQGDSGGPLACQQSGIWVLEGVTSWGYGCAKPGIPGVYTRVSNYAQWIHQRLAEFSKIK